MTSEEEEIASPPPPPLLLLLAMTLRCRFVMPGLIKGIDLYMEIRNEGINLQDEIHVCPMKIDQGGKEKWITEKSSQPQQNF